MKYFLSAVYYIPRPVTGTGTVCSQSSLVVHEYINPMKRPVWPDVVQGTEMGTPQRTEQKLFLSFRLTL